VSPDLRTLAEKATSEQVHPANWSHWVRMILMAGPARNFVEAASPDVILALLDRLDRAETALDGLLRAGFRGDDFLTQNGIPMTATPGVRRAVRKARAALADRPDSPQDPEP
jgi:hypothetical protein